MGNTVLIYNFKCIKTVLLSTNIITYPTCKIFFGLILFKLCFDSRDVLLLSILRKQI